MSSYIVNGEITDLISVDDRALNYGDGVFETLVIVDGKPLYWNDHVQRLARGCRQLRIPVPDKNLLAEELQQLLKHQELYQSEKLIAKLMITRGVGKRGYKPPQQTKATRIVGVFPYPSYPRKYFDEGVKITVCRIPLSCNPVLAGVKHLNRLEQVMAQDEWDSPDIFEGIMLNSDQYVIECTMSNIFWITNNHLFTPDLANCGVEGVTRTNILQLAEELQMSVTIDYFEMKEMLKADEIFITNSVYGILPVNSVDEHQVQIGPLTRKLMNEFTSNTS